MMVTGDGETGFVDVERPRQSCDCKICTSDVMQFDLQNYQSNFFSEKAKSRIKTFHIKFLDLSRCYNHQSLPWLTEYRLA